MRSWTKCTGWVGIFSAFLETLTKLLIKNITSGEMKEERKPSQSEQIVEVWNLCYNNYTHAIVLKLIFGPIQPFKWMSLSRISCIGLCSKITKNQMLIVLQLYEMHTFVPFLASYSKTVGPQSKKSIPTSI